MTAPQCGYPDGSFWAQYDGPCAADCVGMIIPGDAVIYGDDDRLMHATCYQGATRKPRRTERKCAECNLFHAGECI